MYLNLFSSTSNEDLGSQEHDINFLNLYFDLDRCYWEFLGDPIYDASRKGSVDFEFIGQRSIRESSSNNLHENLEIYITYFQ